jgi:acetyltransferase-like isoleucine patch superfamily enzyme
MVGYILDVLKSLKERNAMRRDPCGFARSLGVKVGHGGRFYGISRDMFGSEPWLITIGNNVFITSQVQFITHDGGTLPFRKDIPDLEWTAPITVGNDVFIGYRATIMPGVTIGDRCIIGACALVARSVPSNSVAAGNPAKVIKTADEYLSGLQRKSLRVGHLQGEEKAAWLKKHFGIEGI